MEVKLLILFSLFLGSSLGQSISCTYSILNIDGASRYACTLYIQNLAGFDNFTSISGTHLEGRTDADVAGIQRAIDSKSINIPRIICSQFPNLVVADLQRLGVARLYENSLSDCENLAWLRLSWNGIQEIHEQAFSKNIKLEYIDFDQNLLNTLPENVFSNLVNVQDIELSTNPFISIPGGTFRNLTNLRRLAMIRITIKAINVEWFETLSNLEYLSLYVNYITVLPENSFSNLKNLRYLDISRNPIKILPGNIFKDLNNLEALYMTALDTRQIKAEWFETLQKLELLHIYSNVFTEIPEGTFDSLSSLLALDIGDNNLTESSIPGNLFDKMPNLLRLSASFNYIQNLNPRWFQKLSQLATLSFNFNEITEIRPAIFTPFKNLNKIELWGNSLRALRRDIFGYVGNLAHIDLDANKVTAIDEKLLTEASSLTYLYLWGNLCVSERFFEFDLNREIYIENLVNCTNNFRYFVETITESGDGYVFFPAPQPGIQLRVNTDNEFRIALTPYDLISYPIIEIVIGGRNNTSSFVVRDQETQLIVPTPNIIRPGQWNNFIVKWENNIVLVSREEQNFPFLAYTLEPSFAVRFYGLRSPLSRAVWSIQPFEPKVC